MSNVVTILVKAEDRASSVMERVTGSGHKLAIALSAGVATAATAAGAAVLTSVKSYVELGDSLDEMSSRTGFSVEGLSELSHAATLSGTSIEGLEVGIRKMSSVVYDASRGSQAAADSLAALGLSVEDLLGLSPEEQFEKITSALADVADETAKSALAVDIFGRSGTALLPMLDGGSESLAKMREEAHRLGIVMSEEDAAAAAEFADMMDNAKAALQGAMLTIARVAVPILTEIADWLGPRITAAVELAKVAVAALSDWVGEQWARFRPFYEEEVAPAMQAIEDRVRQVVEFFQENWPLIAEVVQPIIDQVTLVIQTAFELIVGVVKVTLDVIQGDWKGAWTNILGIAQTIAGAIAGTIENLMRLISELFAKMRDLKGMAGTITRAALGPVGAAADVVRELDIPGFATGGVVPGPIGAPTLAVVHGGETVIPVGGQTGGVTININGDVYGIDDLGRKVAEALNRAGFSGPVLNSGVVAS